MIGDVYKAKRDFRKLLGQDVADDLLKRAEKKDAQGYSAKRVVGMVRSKLNKDKYESAIDKVQAVLWDQGIICRLSTWPHTSSNGNFVKLVKNKVYNNWGLVQYLGGKNPLYDPSEERDSLYRYLNLTKNEKDDNVPVGETDSALKNPLKRSHTNNLFSKMNSLRLSNRLKVIVTAFLICLIEYAEDKNKETKKRWEEGRLTKDEFQHLGGSLQADLVKKIIVPEGVKKINSGFMMGRANLESVEIPPGTVKTIGQNAFNGCRNLNELKIGDGVETIENWAFMGCTSLTSVKIPWSVKNINNCAFYNCSGLETLKLSEGIEVIGEHAFANCASLKSVTIPSSVTLIKKQAFWS
ncbi:MAG: leucine-rich repeat domain-containing protein, partial [Clostridia bacterium]|nr:leucine-rich repeat domain-containing protein [Clostridia bacterium]